jgi:hypothetical protein
MCFVISSDFSRWGGESRAKTTFSAGCSVVSQESQGIWPTATLDPLLHMSDLYPLLMVPQFDRRPWGARDLSPLYDRHAEPGEEPIGEAWLTGDKCLVANGPFGGATLGELCQRFGHELVAGLIEVVSGMKVSEFLQKEIFDPLEMTSTGYRYFGDTRERMVTPYEKGADNKMIKTTGMFDEYHEPDAIYEAGGAGLFSTVSDYIKFSQMLACGGSYKGERIMGRKTIDLMRQNQLTPEQLKDFECKYNDGYGYGLGVRTLMDPSKSGNSSIGEFGWTGFMGTYVEIDPSEKLSVVYMHNMIPNMEEYVHLRVRNLAFGCIK